MEHIKTVSQNTDISVIAKEETLVQSTSYHDFIQVLSTIIEKYGADTLKDLERVV